MSNSIDHLADGGSLQELIDSYNTKLMELHGRSDTQSVQEQEQPQNVLPINAEPSTDARPRSGFALEINGESEGESSQQREWMAELERGMAELRSGLAELARGQQELREGIRAYSEGAAVQNTDVGSTAQGTEPNGGSLSHEYDLSAARDQEQRYAQGSNPDEREIANSRESTSDISAAEIKPETGYGSLRVVTYAARQAIPVAGAGIVITRPVNDGELLYSVAQTDIDGRSPVIKLPVTASNNAEQQEYDPPYVIYRVRVSAEGYYALDSLSAQVFDGVFATLPVELVPLSEGEQYGK